MNRLSPLRYPGGKTWLSSKIRIDGNFSWFVEPYAGGASVGLFMLFNGKTKRLWINDLDYRIYCFWHSIVFRNGDFLQKLLDTPINMEEWRRQKNISENASRHKDELELGFSTFFLNRTNYCGILYSAPIGGVEQKGKYKLDARYNKNNLLKRISAIGKIADKIKVSNMPAEELLDKSLPEKTIVYLDPPYVHKKSLYMKSEKDFDKIAKKLRNASFSWFMTIDDQEIAENIYSWAKSKIFTMKYSFLHSSSRKSGNEYIIWNNMDCPINYNPVKNKKHSQRIYFDFAKPLY